MNTDWNPPPEADRWNSSQLFAEHRQLKAGHATRRRRREFLAFMNDVVAEYPNRELHVVLDNLNTHKPKTDRWLARHPRVHFHYTPTRASWLNHRIGTMQSYFSNKA
jgi:hypothetical protein